MNDPALEELMELARQAPAPPGQRLTGASEADIAKLENEIGRTLSGGYRRWLMAANGAMLGPGGMFGIRDKRDFLSTEKYLALHPEWQSLGWVPIAGDGLGNYWVVVPQGPDGTSDWVAFVDTHEDPANVDRYVASNVLKFVRFLLESELGETRWPGDRGYDLERDPALAAAPEDKAAWSPRLLVMPISRKVLSLLSSWDCAPVDNDTAADFAADLDGAYESARLSMLRAALATAALVARGLAGGADFQSRNYGPAKDLPPIPEDLIPIAADVVDRLLSGDNDVKEYWSESHEAGKWLAIVRRLRAVLAGDSAYVIDPLW
jgi:cell wall assembly regulator SMI1